MEADACDQLTVSGACDHQMYSGVCTEHLLRYQMCHSNGSTANRSQEGGVVYIPSGQASHEGIARDAILNLTLLDPSPNCKTELAGFICLSLFSVCTVNGEVVRPSSGQCERLRAILGVSEGERAEHYNTTLRGLCDGKKHELSQASKKQQKGIYNSKMPIHFVYDFRLYAHPMLNIVQRGYIHCLHTTCIAKFDECMIMCPL